jgi:hypothetical protein
LETVVCLRRQSGVCRSEGLESKARVSVTIGPRVTVLKAVTGSLLDIEEPRRSERAPT